MAACKIWKEHPRFGCSRGAIEKLMNKIKETRSSERRNCADLNTIRKAIKHLLPRLKAVEFERWGLPHLKHWLNFLMLNYFVYFYIVISILRSNNLAFNKNTSYEPIKFYLNHMNYLSQN